MTSVAKRIPLKDGAPPQEVLTAVQQALAGGGLVAMPTETVYGVAARADDETALAALRELKRRQAADPLTWHVGSREALGAFTDLGACARRLAERYWPGPLTLVLRGVPEGLEHIASEGWTGLRLPAHAGTAGVLDQLPFPVVLSSVNHSGEPPLLDPDVILERFGGELSLILDSGPSRLGESSGVLKLGPGVFELQREGLISLDDLRAAAGLRMAFCCTGNTCRSPMAEGLARLELARRLGVKEARMAEFGFELSSMGVHAGVGAPASAQAVEVLRGEGHDLSAHQSSPATLERLIDLDRVYCLTEAHREQLLSLLPPGRGEHLELLDPEGGSIPDPIGGSEDVYRACMERIRDGVARRAEDWA